MEEGYELDLTYVTERIIAVSFPRASPEDVYQHNLKDVTRMLKSKHAENYLIINLSEKRHDLSKMNPKTLDTGWPDLHAPPLDKICTICKAMEGWLHADPLHVVVIHCRGGKGRIGVVISSFVHFTDISASADQALDRFAMRKYYDDKVSALMTPSQKRYVWILNSLLSGSMKINASPLFLHCIVLHGIPNFNASGVCHPYLKVYQGMQAVYSSGIYHIGPGHRDRICITLEPAQLLKGDIMVKCYNKSEGGAEREVIFRLQFHTGAVQGFNLMFEKEDMESANRDPRFPDYGKVELVFSEGPEKIPGAERWQNGAEVSVDYGTADPLTRWDSYHNLCDGEAPRSRGPLAKRSPNGGGGGGGGGGGASTPGRGPRAASTASSPDHSDHALSASSDSGLSSTSLWAERPPHPASNANISANALCSSPSSSSAATTSAGAKGPSQGPSRQEKAQLKRLLSGFGLEDDPSLEEMADLAPGVGVQQRLVPAQVHVANGNDPAAGGRPRGERETDILDDEVLLMSGGGGGGHRHGDLRSADSLGTLSSSCHKSSQNSLLSDGFGGGGALAGEEPQHHHHHHHHQPAAAPHAAHHQPTSAIATVAADDYERGYAAARRGCMAGRSASVASSTPATSAAAIAMATAPKQQVYRQGSYSTQTWVRQQQMVVAQQYAYRPEEEDDEEEEEEEEGYRRDKSVGGGATPPKLVPLTEPQVAPRGYGAEQVAVVATTTLARNNSKRDEEFDSLTTDIDNSIDQLNQLIMDLDPTFVPVPTRSESVRRGSGAGGGGGGGGGPRVNGSAPNGVGRRLAENSAAAGAQQTAVQCGGGGVRADATRALSRHGNEVADHPGYCGSGWGGVAGGGAEEYRSARTYTPPSQNAMLYRSDSVDYRVQGLDMDSGVEAGLDVTPPTPAFPISPPTPYVKNMVEFSHLRQTPSPSMHSYGTYRTEHEPRGYPEMIAHGLSSDEGLPDSAPNCHWSFGAARSASVGGTLHRTESPCSVVAPWPDAAPLSRHSSLSGGYPGYPAPSRHPPGPAHSASLDYGGRHSPPSSSSTPLHPYPPPPHPHPAPNAHSSPRGGQRHRQACYALQRHSPARSFDDHHDDAGYPESPAVVASSLLLLGNGGGAERGVVHSRERLPPLLPEKRRASDGELSLGTASPAPSGFSSPHSGSSLSIPFPSVLPDLSVAAAMATAGGSAPSPLPDVLVSKQVTVKFVQDTSRFWYKPDISRDQAISVLKEKDPGCFIVRDSHSFRGAYGLAMKVATPPPSVLQQSKKGGDLANELVRHFLIECTQKGVRLKGCPNEPYFGSLTALVCQHSITPLALPCKLIIPDRDPLEDVMENTSQSVTNSAAELLKQGAACNVWFLGSVEMESLTGYQAVQKAASAMLGSEGATSSSTVVHFKVSSQGITLTDNQRRLFFRRHYAVNTVIFCSLDPKDRKWTKDGCTSAKIFGFVARKSGSAMDNVCHLFAEHDPEQPASAIVNFVSKVMIGSLKAK